MTLSCGVVLKHFPSLNLSGIGYEKKWRESRDFPGKICKKWISGDLSPRNFREESPNVEEVKSSNALIPIVSSRLTYVCLLSDKGLYTHLETASRLVLSLVNRLKYLNHS
jgi:hypothetical protein